MIQGVRSREGMPLALSAPPLAAAPQCEQYRAPGDTGPPQLGQFVTSLGRPQAEQNCPVPGLPQLGQGVAELLTGALAE